jgi:TRAP transporter TAXI family solute receptor
MRTIVLALAAVCAGSVSLAQDLRLFSVASGNVTGGYYAAARAICGVVNRESGGEIRCSPEPTSGSLYNLDAIAEKQAEFALVQSDWHRFAYEGVDVFADVGGLPDIRSVMSLYPEALTILTRADSGIEGSADLLGRSVDIGHPSSGRHATIVRLLGALRLGEANFTELTEFTDNAAINELCDGRLDAVVLIVGHPN